MMKLKQLFTLIFTLSLPVLIGAVKYCGTVQDENGKAVAEVWIQGGAALSSTDAEGNFCIQTDADSLVFSRLGYHERHLAVRDLPKVVILTPAPLSLPPILVYESIGDRASQALDAEIIFTDTNSNQRNTAEILLDQDYISSSDIALTGEYQSLSILGNLSRHTLVMIDGIAVNSAGEPFDFSRIPPSQISRIEIIKGSSSVYGGSSAIGGIVNIISTHPQDQAKILLGSGTGAFGMNSQRYQVSLARKNYSLSAEYSHYFARNDFIYEPSWDAGQEYRRQHNRKTADYFFMKALYRRPKQFLELVLSYDSYLRELPGPVSFPELYDAAKQTGSNGFVRLSHISNFAKASNELTLFCDFKESVYNNLSSSNPLAAIHYRQYHLSPLLKNEFSLALPLAQIDLGAEIKPVYYRYQEPPQDQVHIAFGDYENLNTALYGRAQKELEHQLFLSQSSFALRQDWAQDEKHLSWRAEQRLSLLLPVELELHGSIGTAFSLPSYFDRHWIGDSQTQGDAELLSETSFGYNLGLRLKHELFQLQAAYHANEIDQLIQWRQYFLNGSTWRPFNVGHAKISNWELNLGLNPSSNLSLTSGITFTKAKDFSKDAAGEPSATYNKYLPYTPKYNGVSSLSYGYKGFGAKISYHYVGKQYSTVDNLAGEMAAFALLNMSLKQELELFFLDLRIDLRLNNILDHRYEIYAHIPQPGFNWQCGLTLSYAWNL